MAKNVGQIILSGKCGDLIHYVVNGEPHVKPAHKGRNETKSKAVLNSRSNLGTASSSGKIFRYAFEPHFQFAKDRNYCSRLTAKFIHALKTDYTNPPGNKMAGSSDLSILKGFNFNKDCPLDSIFFSKPIMNIDRKEGTLIASLSHFNPKEIIKANASATHFQIILCSSEIDFINESYCSDHCKTEFVKINDDHTFLESYILKVTEGTTLPIFVAMSIQYFQEVNNVMYQLKGKNSNPFAIIEVDR